MHPTNKVIACPQVNERDVMYDQTGVSFARLDTIYSQVYNSIFKPNELGHNTGEDMRQIDLKKVFHYVKEICSNENEVFITLLQIGMDTQNFVNAGKFLDINERKKH